MSCAKEKAIDYLSRREHSRLELKRKLHAKQFLDAEIKTALDELAFEKKQCDARFTECYVRVRKLAGFGPLRIIAELRERGVSDALIHRYIHEDSDDWYTHLHDVFKRKFSEVANTLKEKEKQFRYLITKGFSSEMARDFLFS